LDPRADASAAQLEEVVSSEASDPSTICNGGKEVEPTTMVVVAATVATCISSTASNLNNHLMPGDGGGYVVGPLWS